MNRVVVIGSSCSGKSTFSRYLSKKCEIQIAYAIGVAEPTSVTVDTFGTEHIPAKQIEQIVRQEFDLRPYSIIKMLDLIKPIYQPLSAYGHMGREDLNVSWEATPHVADLREAAGL